jgi:hypothetical protein
MMCMMEEDRSSGSSPEVHYLAATPDELFTEHCARLKCVVVSNDMRWKSCAHRVLSLDCSFQLRHAPQGSPVQ